MADNSKPSINPANQTDLAGLFDQVLNKYMQGVENMLPGIVIAFDRDSNRVQVQPQIMMVNTADQTVERAQIASIPVFQISGGGCILNFNLKPGDLGWIKANDRDISLFLQSFKASGPNTFRQHKFSDAVFFPDVMRGYTINDEDAENAVLQTLDGTQRVSIWPDQVKVTSNNKIIMDAPEIVLDAPLTTITGNLTMGDGTKTATFNGDMLVSGDVVAGAGTISLTAHVHSGVQPGGGNTGAPVP